MTVRPVSLLLLLSVWLSSVVAGANAQQLDGDSSCAVCHPGAVRGLRTSVHARLWFEAATQPRACSLCHGDLGAHVAAAARPGQGPPIAVPPVAAARCADCHPGRALQVAAGAHVFVALLPPSPRPAAAADAQQLQELAAAAAGGIDWSGLLDVGYRMVHVGGSRQGYETDVDLEPGARVRAAELRGAGGGDAVFDELRLEGHDLGDPRWSAGARARQDDLGAAAVDFRRDRYRYDGGGDFHRVDRTARALSGDAEVELGSGVRAFAAFARHDDDGYWLVQRIGNRNVSVQSYVDGVDSPRHARREESELGLRGRAGDFDWAVAALLRDDRERDRWSYSRPAPANPAFDESEDFTSSQSLRGPGGRLQLGGEFEALSFDLTARFLDHDRRVVAAGQSAGFDIAQFTTQTTALGLGTAQTALVDFAATLDVADGLAVVVDLHWRDHQEDLRLQQTDVSTFPTLSSTVVVQTDVDQHTVQRLLDGTARLEWTPDAALDLGVGYGFAQEQLRVPDLDPGDPRDFRRGTARDGGVVADLRWRPCELVTVRGDLRDFAQDGALLHELAPERARAVGGSIALDTDGQRAAVFVRHRQNDNDVSDHHLDALAVGGTAGVGGRDLQLDLGYTFARTDSRTRTSFYFDPDPNPVTTVVGFDGDTHTWTGSLAAAPSGDLRWRFAAAWTRTTGDYAVSYLDWTADLRWQLDGDRRAVGAEYRLGRYRDDAGLRDWDAQSVFVYWRQVF